MFLFCSVSLFFREERSNFFLFFDPFNPQLAQLQGASLPVYRVWSRLSGVPSTARGSGVECVSLVLAVTCCPGLPWFYCTVGLRYRPSRRSQGRNFSTETRASLSVPWRTVSRADEKGRCCACCHGCGFLPGAPPKRQHRPTVGTSACGLGSWGLTFHVDGPHASAFTLAVLFFHL